MRCTECDEPYNCEYPGQLPIPETCKSSKKLSNISTNSNQKYNWPNVANIKFSIETVKNSVSNNMSLSAIEQELPTDFSWLSNQESIISHGLENQGYCGCCWAFSIAMVMSDRYAIRWGKYRPKISVAHIIMCANNSNSGNYYDNKFGYQGQISDQPSDNRTQCTCGGNNYISSKYLEKKGVKLQECWPYEESVKKLSTMECPKKLECLICNSDSTTFSLEKDSTTYLAFINGNKLNYQQTILNIKKSISAEGPVMTNFRVPNNFKDWWESNSASDIYTPPNEKISENNSGNHAVSLVGWGKDPNTGQEYWIMRNSWGSTHGSGFFTSGVGYCKFAITPEDTQDDYKTGIDSPYKNGMFWEGGAVSFKVKQSFLSNGKEWGEPITEELTTKPMGDPPTNFGRGSTILILQSHIKKYWYIYLIIIVIIIIILLFT